MKYSVDLHLHSCLSPCGDNDMTPNNIANMAMLNELEIVALTDHNSYYNSKVFSQLAINRGILPVYGMEVTTAEEIHVLTLLPSYQKLEQFGKQVYDALLDIKNRVDIFGQQLVMDIEDEIIFEEQKLLIGATTLTSDDVVDMVNSLGGVVLPAHIDRQSYSMLHSFGTIPKEYGFKTVELSKECDPRLFFKMYPECSKYNYISSSDAHYLENMSVGDFKLELEEKSVECVIDYLKKGRCFL